ncbi:GGDEF domain-containing protein [Colwellia echini]|uniref:diguanylate cyclase n=1 Tax=Colwellia echini TaxID=1982103 RepID=A0ABY3N1X5_9GAMM|nr:GGDEF domain-containing protein [Colwellia echini]TYK67475.1 GGDEF domain-containing protein [Colwellia echini]
MNISLLQRIAFFTLGCFVLFSLLIGSVIWSSQEIKAAFTRENYAQQLTNQTNMLRQLINNNNIYDKNYSIYNKRNKVDDWQALQVKLSSLLESAPALTTHQQSIQSSLVSQNNNLRNFFTLINKNKLKNANVAIKTHLKARLMTQLESIRADSFQLSAIAEKDIYDTIKQQAFFIILVSSASIIALILGAFSLTYIVRKSLNEVKSAFEKNESGDFQHIELSHHSQEFDNIVDAFNTMNDKLSESTISLTEMKKIVEERTQVLEKLSKTDALTKVANRRALFERANIEFSRTLRGNQQLTLLLLDCDLFKNINDDYGHVFGDELLVHICNICQQEIRDIDFLARYGGEEFIIVLPNCDLNGGIETAHRIQRSLAKNCLTIGDKEVKATLSIGVSMFNQRHKSLEQLIHDTDQAMYQAKRNGRNRVEVHSYTSLH